jgi:hypothetical protein
MLERWIREHSSSENGWIITLLFYLLNHWNRKNTGLHPQTVGLPQDALADCSRILANYYLHRYDKFAQKVCDDIGALYFRYADDQMILLNDLDKIEHLLLLLSRNLDTYGLRINQKKVYIWTADELKTHRFRDIQSIFSEKGDNNKPSLVRKFVDEYLLIQKETLEKSWNKGNPLLNRLLWANLESLPSEQFEKIIDRLTSDQFILLADHEKIQRIYKLNSHSKNPIDFVNLLKDIGDRSVHNSYHYAVLAFAILIKDTELKTHFESRIQSLQYQMETCKIC